MNKVELEAKVDALMDEINFLRAFYDAVSGAHCSPQSPWRLGALGWAPRLPAPTLICSLLPTPTLGWNSWSRCCFPYLRRKMRFCGS